MQGLSKTEVLNMKVWTCESDTTEPLLVLYITGVCHKASMQDIYQTIIKQDFTAYPWLSTNGIYQWQLRQIKDYIYVVEWLIDFLTVRQYETNVVGLKRCKKLSRWYY